MSRRTSYLLERDVTPPAWYDMPEADWQKSLRAEADWQKVARTDPLAFWLGATPTKAGDLVLGVHKGTETIATIPDDLRSRHVYIAGASGSGKSTLLVHLMKQDMEQGRGFAMVDPHGELIDLILPHIPKSRIEDTVYFNPSDRDCPISLNPLLAETEEERDMVTANFMVLFTRLFGVKDAPRLNHILRHVVLTLLESGNKSFLDIRSLLMHGEFRAQVLAGVHNPFLLEFWEEEFPKLPRNAIDPIVNKLAQFRLNSIIRNALGRPETTIDFAEIMRTGKLFFANLAQGKIQEENTILLGSIIASQIQLATMRRAALPRDDWAPFTFYIDEFQNFTANDNSAFQKILSEARKYNLSLVLAHQFTSQIPGDLRSAVLGIVYTMVLFRVGLEDARLLQAAFPSQTAEKTEKVIQKLQSLSIGEAIIRSGRADNNFPIKTFPPPPTPLPNFVREVIEYSRAHYGRPPARPTHSSRPAGSAPTPPSSETHSSEEPVTTHQNPGFEEPPIDPWQ